MYCLTVTFNVRPANAAAFIDAVRENARRSAADEPGCRVFDVCVDAGGTRIFLYELYDDEAAFAAHLKTSHFAVFDKQVAPWVIDKSVSVWHKLES
jgi:(4S)-4-hydroxy-5-phosphonooxypentane-2,3-dione isomerase